MSGCVEDRGCVFAAAALVFLAGAAVAEGISRRGRLRILSFTKRSRFGYRDRSFGCLRSFQGGGLAAPTFGLKFVEFGVALVEVAKREAAGAVDGDLLFFQFVPQERIVGQTAD